MVPTAAKIPAPRTYTNYAVVEQLVVNPWAWGCRAPGRSAGAVARPSQPRVTGQMGSLAGAAHLLQDNAGVPKHCSGGTKTPQRGAGHRHC